MSEEQLMIIDINVNDALNLSSDFNQELESENAECPSILGQGLVPGPHQTDDLFGDSNILAVKSNFQAQLEKICRCCATETEDLNSIYDPDDCIASMITILTAIQPRRDDGLPSQICIDCLGLLAKSTNFKQRVETADRTLRQLLAMDICQVKVLQRTDVEQLARKLTKMTELDLIIFGTDMQLPDPDNIGYIEENSLDISKAEEETQEEEEEEEETPEEEEEDTQMFPTPEVNSNTESENEETHLKGREIAHHHLGVNDNKRNKKRTKVKQKSIRKAFQCAICEYKFTDPQLYMSHIKTHPESKTLYGCTVCSRNFKNRTSMENHFLCHHPAEIQDSPKQYKCRDCEMSFSVENDLYIHGSIHESGDKFICRKCEKEFPNCLKLKRHVRIHFEDKPYKCELCGKGFPEMGSLTRHFRFHTGEKRERKHICNTCGKSYYDSHSLSVHKRTHTGEKPWICKECGRGFIDSRLLNSHLKTHKEEKMYACDRCGKRFTHQSTLTTHIRVHTGEKPYICVICNKSFIQSSNLNLHMRVHSGEKPYQCKVCSRAFASSSTLTTHVRTHTGEKPYVCPQCGKPFARHDLSAHLRTHTGEKPFRCEICSRKFTTSGQLSQHKRSHSGEKPYTCKICDKSWATSAYLRKHMKMHNVPPENGQQAIRVEKQNCNGGGDDDDDDDDDDNDGDDDENARLFSGQDDDFLSDSELNENAVLVSDLLAAVVDSSVDNMDNSIAVGIDQAIDPNILRLQ